MYYEVKTYVVGTHQKCLSEGLLMSTHNICFRGEIRKILCGYPLLSVAMDLWKNIYRGKLTLKEKKQPFKKK